MRIVVLVLSGLVLTACAPQPGSVDPCTGRAADLSLETGGDKSGRRAALRQAYWRDNPNLSQEEACSAGGASAARVFAEEAQATRNARSTAAVSPPATAAPATRPAALTNKQIDDLMTFSTMVGRSIGCGLNMESQTVEIANFLNKNVPDRSTRQAYTRTVTIAVNEAATQQASGQSPDTCAAVERGMRGVRLR